MIPELKAMFENNKLGNFMANQGRQELWKVEGVEAMISLIGIGEAGCNVVSLFENHKEYNCFLFSEDQENTKYTRNYQK